MPHSYQWQTLISSVNIITPPCTDVIHIMHLMKQRVSDDARWGRRLYTVGRRYQLAAELRQYSWSGCGRNQFQRSENFRSITTVPNLIVLSKRLWWLVISSAQDYTIFEAQLEFELYANRQLKYIKTATSVRRILKHEPLFAVGIVQFSPIHQNLFSTDIFGMVSHPFFIIIFRRSKMHFIQTFTIAITNYWTLHFIEMTNFTGFTSHDILLLLIYGQTNGVILLIVKPINILASNA